MRPNRIFSILKAWCTAGLYAYFRKLQVNNVKAVRVKGPVIFIPTHQNAFLDAVLVICTTPRNPWSIARASVFKKGLVTKLLTIVQIKPVFRIRDGWSSLKHNDAIMLEWINMLASGQDIMIFAEGNHNEPYATGTLQRGFARMALKFQQQHQTPLTIIPVAIHYDDHQSFRSRVLVNYGDPISVGDLLHESLNEREKLEKLVDVTASSLRNLAVAIEPDENYKSKYDFLKTYRAVEKDMVVQLRSDRDLLHKYPDPPATKANRAQGNLFLKIINPIVWIGWTFHILPYSLIRSFIRKKVKDPQFIGSLKYAFGIFLVPIYYLILLLTFFLITHSIPGTIAFFIILPVSGLLGTDILKK